MKEISASDILASRFIHTVPALDVALGGGLMTGQLVSIASRSGVGKSTVGAFMALQAQRQLAMPSLFIAAEYRSFNNKTFIDRCGINTDLSKFLVVESAEDFCGSKILGYAEKKLKSNQPWFIVVDSIQSLLTEKAVLEGMEATDPGRFASMIGKFCQLALPLCALNGSVVILLKQQRGNMSMGKAPSPQGGYCLEHSVSTELKMFQGKEITNGDEDVGFKVSITVEKSPCSKPTPYGKNMVEVNQFYSNGIDLEYNLIDHACMLGLVESAEGGGWHTIRPVEGLDWPTEDMKIQGRFATVDAIRQHPTYVEYLLKECHETTSVTKIVQPKKRGRKSAGDTSENN